MPLLFFATHCARSESFYPRRKIKCAAERTKKPGDVLPVTDSYHYALPTGLKPGTLVKLIHFDTGYWIVETNGERFTVFQTRIDAELEYEWHGRWLPASDPRIQAMRNRETLKDSPAYSCVGWMR